MKRTILHATRARRRWSAMLSRVEHAGERIVIIRSGREVAALVPAEDLELLEQLADDGDIATAHAEIEEAKQQPTIPWGEVKSYFEVDS